MSQLRTALLRSADTCFTNQRTLKSLNAFVTQPGGEVPGHVQNKDLIEADRRWADGQSTTRLVDHTLIDFT